MESCAVVTKIWGGGGGEEFCACHKNIGGGGGGAGVLPVTKISGRGGRSFVPVTKISEGAGVLCLLELAPSHVHDPAEAYLILAPQS